MVTSRKATITATVVMAAAMGVLATPSTAKQFDHPRPVEPGMTIVTMAPSSDTTAPLGIGRPIRIAMCDTWMTSDYEVDFFTSNYLWCDYENLQVVAGFFPARDKNVRASVVITNSAGAQVFLADGEFPVETSAINYVVANVGSLPAGFYKVQSKIRQGKKTLSQKFWLQVTLQSDPQCVPPS